MRKLGVLAATCAALIACLALSVPAQAIPPIDLLTDFDVRMDGAATADLAGRSVSSAGDVNGDGVDDVVVGAPNADGSGRTDSGLVYVVFGDPTNTGTLDLGAIGTQDNGQGFLITGADSGDFAGFSVSGAGDVNGDGVDDVVVGAPNADSGGRERPGSAYVLFGKLGTIDSIDLADIGTPGNTAGFRIDGAGSYDDAGFSVSNAGDVNGDGVDGVVIGALFADNNERADSGSAYVVYGRIDDPTTPEREDTATVDLAELGTAGNGQGFSVYGASADGWAGFSVSGAGDVNGDGVDDVVVGAPNADSGGRERPGSAYVLFGKLGTIDSIDLADIGTPGNTAGFRIDGAGSYDDAGFSVSNAGDVNGDGVDGVVIGALFADNNERADSGSAYVVYGRIDDPTTPEREDTATVDLAELGTAGNDQGLRIDGAGSRDYAGEVVSDAGDINRDGADDVIVAAPDADGSGRTDSGSVHVVFGRIDDHATPEREDTATVDLAEFGTTGNDRGLRIDGSRSYEYAGLVSGGGDVNSDGCPDVIIGAPRASNNGIPFSGSAYIVFGRTDFARNRCDPRRLSHRLAKPARTCPTFAPTCAMRPGG